MKTTKEILINAKSASASLALLPTEIKDRALLAMADAIEAASADILAANELDVEASRGSLSSVMIDRLILTEARIKGMADGIRNVVKLPDPVGKKISDRALENGLKIEKVTCRSE